MRSLKAFLGPCVGLLLFCTAASTAARNAVGDEMDGPFGTSSFELPKQKVGNIQLSSGEVTVPDSDDLGRIGLVLFHSGFGVRIII